MHKGILLWNFTVYDGGPWDFERLGWGDEHWQSQACKRDANISCVSQKAKPA